MTDLKRTEQPDLTVGTGKVLAVRDLTVDAALELARTDAAQLAARLRGDKRLAPSLWPTKAQPRRVRFLYWQWQVLDEVTGGVLDEGYAVTETLAWTRTDRAAKRIRDERAAKRAES